MYLPQLSEEKKNKAIEECETLLIFNLYIFIHNLFYIIMFIYKNYLKKKKKNKAIEECETLLNFNL